MVEHVEYNTAIRKYYECMGCRRLWNNLIFLNILKRMNKQIPLPQIDDKRLLSFSRQSFIQTSSNFKQSDSNFHWSIFFCLFIFMLLPLQVFVISWGVGIFIWHINFPHSTFFWISPVFLLSIWHASPPYFSISKTDESMYTIKGQLSTRFLSKWIPWWTT